VYNTRCTFPQHTHLPAHHRRSLSALLKDHVLVKVKVNGVSDEAAIAAIAQQLAQGAGAALLQVKGSTLLYADASQPLERLVQVGGPSPTIWALDAYQGPGNCLLTTCGSRILQQTSAQVPAAVADLSASPSGMWFMWSVAAMQLWRCNGVLHRLQEAGAR
jgi:hypothetical protein